MPEGAPQDYQEILNQIHSNVFLNRLKDHLDLDGKSDLNENDASELNDLDRRLLVEDVSPSIEREDIEKLLEDDEIRDELLKATRSFVKSQSKEA